MSNTTKTENIFTMSS